MSTFKITVAGVDRSLMLDTSTLDIDLVTARKGSTAQFTLIDTSLAFNIDPLDEVMIYDIDGVTPIFSGVITKPTAKPEATSYNRLDCTAQDDFYYFDSTLVNEAYTNQTADYIVKALVSKYLTGVTTNHVQAGPPIPYIILAHRSLTQAFRKLAKMASSTDPVLYWVDPSSDLHWGTLTQLTDSGVLLSDLDADSTAVRYERKSIEYDLDGTQVTNSVVVRGGMGLSNTYSETFAADGHQTSFALAYTPSQQTGAILPSVTVGGVAQTVAFDNGSAPTTQWVIGNQIPGSSTLVTGTSVLRAASASAPSTGTLVAVTYQYDFPVIVRATSNASVARYNKPGSKTKGVHGTAVTDQTIRTTSAAQAKANSVLQTNAFHLQTTKLIIPEQYTGAALQVGQTVTWTCGQLGVSALSMAVIESHIKGTKDQQRRQELTLEV